MTKNIIDQLEEFVSFVESLVSLDEGIWYSPIGEGKWRIHDIIAHIMMWDKYFNETTFPLINQDGSPELKEHPDYLGYNEQSIRYGKDKTKNEIINETLKNRKKMVLNLKNIEDKAFSYVYPGEREFTLERYLEEFFISHDEYHIKQIKEFITSHK